MEQERISLNARERERLKVLHEIEQGHLRQVEAARRLRLTARQVRRLWTRWRTAGDGGVGHPLRGRPPNRENPEAIKRRCPRQVRQARYTRFGPPLAAGHLGPPGLCVCRE